MGKYSPDIIQEARASDFLDQPRCSFTHCRSNESVKKDRRPPSLERTHPLNTKEKPFHVDFSGDENDDDENDDEECPSPSTVFGTRRKAPSRNTSPEDQPEASTSQIVNRGPPSTSMIPSKRSLLIDLVAKRQRMTASHYIATSTRSSARLNAQSRSEENESGTRSSFRASPTINDPSGDSFEADVVSAQLRPLSYATSIGSTQAHHTHPHTIEIDDSDADAEHEEAEVVNDHGEVFISDTQPTPEFPWAGADEHDSLMGPPELEPRSEPRHSPPIPEFTCSYTPMLERHESEGTFVSELQSPEYETQALDHIEERQTPGPPTLGRQSSEPPHTNRKPSVKTDPSPYSTPPPRTPGPTRNTPASAVQFRATPFGDSVVVSMNGNVPHRVLFASSGHKSKALANARRSSVIASPLPVRAPVVPAPVVAPIMEPGPAPGPEPVPAGHDEEDAQDAPTFTPTPAPTQPVGVRLPLKKKNRDSTDPLLAETLQAAVRKGHGKPRLSATESAYFSNKPKGPSRLREGGNMSV